jgi:hypothetical protein
MTDETHAERWVAHVGKLYDPTVMLDYGGLFFKHQVSKVIQLDIKDTSGELVPPGKTFEALRPGTLILANCSLHCFIMKESRID